MAHSETPDHAELSEFRHGHPDDATPRRDGDADVDRPEPLATRVEVARTTSGYHLTVVDDTDRTHYTVDALVLNNRIEELAVGDRFEASGVIVIVGPAREPSRGLLAWVRVV